MKMNLETPPKPVHEPLKSIEAMAPASGMKRPRRMDDAIVREAAGLLAVECVKWDNTSSADDWIESLVKVRHSWDDGYKFARDLEQAAHVEPDADLVELLGDGYEILSTVHEREVRRWVQIVGFTPAHAVGDRVGCANGIGPIHEVRVATAQYVVDVKGTGNGGYVINAEDIRPVEASN